MQVSFSTNDYNSCHLIGPLTTTGFNLYPVKFAE